MGGGPSGPEGGRVTVSLVDFQDRERDAFETLAEMQATLGTGLAGATVSVDKPQEGPPTGAPVSVEIVGEDPGQLKVLSDQVLEVLRESVVSPKLVGLESDMDEARAELSVRVDREKAAPSGLRSTGSRRRSTERATTSTTSSSGWQNPTGWSSKVCGTSRSWRREGFRYPWFP
jgi:multidrug efflux pump subunit AcrB